ncbi:MAG: DUF2868 domain-containing protein [Verrucomicrobia bacterium]|nr:DUF2868 domain-containing protein [Verrucomicrobiota bacterium]
MDFEALLGKADAATDERLLREKVKGLDGAHARRAAIKVWLDGQRRGKDELPGDVWGGGRFLVGAVVCLVMFLAGIGVMTGMLDRERMGFHVPMVMGVAVGLQLLVLVGAGVLWLLRGKMGLLQKLFAWLIGKFSAEGDSGWWRILRLEGGRAWEALGWNLVRMTQAGAVMFSIGLMAGLLGCIWFLEVSFFWDSTTPEWMAKKIYEVCGFLSMPWSWWTVGWVPGETTIQVTRWGVEAPLVDDLDFMAVWYRFLFAAIFFWALLPRLVLWILAVFKERKALSSLDFQAKRHRELWREIMGTRRADVSEAPLDGVLVLDVGGTGLKEESLRGFLLRRLRVNPGEWYEVGVWDEKGEEAAVKSLRNAPAGVVFLAEGWALLPPRMKALHSQVRSIAGSETCVYFLVVNSGGAGEPLEVKDEEKTIWKDFVDGLADASAEIFFYEKEEGQ